MSLRCVAISALISTPGSLNCFNNLVTPAKDAAVVLLALASVLVAAFVAGFVVFFVAGFVVVFVAGLVAGFVPDFVVDFARGFVVVFAMIFPPLRLNGYCRGSVTTDNELESSVP